jgi:two-component system response regulator VicR
LSPSYFQNQKNVINNYNLKAHFQKTFMAKRILVLDDNIDILDVVHETLSYEQFEVKSTSNADDVIPMIVEFNPHLVILDFRVGQTNGGEICRQIKAHPKFGELPVLLFSAYIKSESELFAYGCDAVINKPFDLNELIEKVNGLINC